MFLPYLPYYSFGEKLAVLDNTTTPSGLGYALASVSALLSKNLVDSLDFVKNRDGYIESIESNAEKSYLGKIQREMLERSTDYIYEAKVIIIGDGGSGKTSLLRRLYQPEKPLPNESDTTKGIEIYRHEFKLKNGHNFRLNIWDFAGQEIYHATHQFFLTRRSLYVLLDDTRKDDKTVHDPSFKYWLGIADLLGDHSPVLIFQNEKGGRRKTIDESGIKAKFDNVKDVYRGNLENAGSTDGLAKAIEFYVQTLPHVGEELPAKWIAIRTDIERLARNTPFISQQVYFDIYRNHLAFDRAKALHLQPLSPRFRSILTFSG